MYLQNYSCISYIQTSNSGHCLLGKTNNDSLNRKKQLISRHKFKFASLFSHLCHKLPAKLKFSHGHCQFLVEKFNFTKNLIFLWIKSKCFLLHIFSFIKQILFLILSNSLYAKMWSFSGKLDAVASTKDSWYKVTRNQEHIQKYKHLQF